MAVRREDHDAGRNLSLRDSFVQYGRNAGNLKRLSGGTVAMQHVHNRIPELRLIVSFRQKDPVLDLLPFQGIGREGIRIESSL